MGFNMEAAVNSTPTGGESRKSRGSKSAGGGWDKTKGFFSGLLTGATAGEAGKVGDRLLAPDMNITQDTPDMLFGPVIGGAIGSLMDLPEREAGPVSDAMRGAQEAAPWSNFFGDLIGSVLLGGGITGFGRKLGTEALEKGGPMAKKASDFLMNTKRGRAATATTAGAGEGYVRAENLGEDPFEGALWGGMGGGTGQVILGELLPWVARGVTHSDKPTKAAQMLMGEAEARTGTGGATGREFPVEDIKARRAALGEEATLPDVNPGFRRTAEALTSSKEALPHIPDLLYRFDPEGVRPPQINDKFQADVVNALPDMFKGANNPRSLTQIGTDAAEKRAALQPEWDKVLDEGPDPMFTTALIKNNIGQYVDFNLTTDITQKAKQQLDKTISRLSRESKVQLQQKGIDPKTYPPDYLSPRAVLTLRKELDQIANRALKSTDQRSPELAKHVLDARRGLNDLMLEEIPQFGQINAQYSNEFSYERAADAAYKAIRTQKYDIEDLRIAMRSADPADMPAFMEGTARAIVDMLADDKVGLSSARAMLKNDRFQAKVAEMLGAEPAVAIMKAADEAVTLMKTTQSVGGKSPTQLRQAAASTLEKAVQSTLFGAGLFKMMGGLKGSVVAPSTAVTAGIAQKGARGLSRAQQGELYPLMDRWLSATGKDADASLDEIMKLSKETTPSRSLRGRGFDEKRPPSVFNTIMDTDVGQTPALAAGSLASRTGTTESEKNKRKRRARANSR